MCHRNRWAKNKFPVVDFIKVETWLDFKVGKKKGGEMQLTAICASKKIDLEKKKSLI